MGVAHAQKAGGRHASGLHCILRAEIVLGRRGEALEKLQRAVSKDLSNWEGRSLRAAQRMRELHHPRSHAPREVSRASPALHASRLLLVLDEVHKGMDKKTQRTAMFSQLGSTLRGLTNHVRYDDFGHADAAPDPVFPASRPLPRHDRQLSGLRQRALLGESRHRSCHCSARPKHGLAVIGGALKIPESRIARARRNKEAHDECRLGLGANALP